MASFDIAYLIKLTLKPDEGSQLPIQDRHLVYTQEHDIFGWQVEMRPGKIFNQDEEDLWLFDINIKLGSLHNPTVMTFTIGPYTFDYSWNWEFFRTMNDKGFKVCYLPPSRYEEKTRSQWLAIRAPKMTNPAITISGTGDYAAVRKVGLFVRRDSESLHEFICVKTSDRLTGRFAERYADKKWWYDAPWKHGVDVAGRAVTLFPKQLYGTDGSRELYRKFVTVDDDVKDRALSMAHQRFARQFADSAQGENPLRAYMWLQNCATEIVCTTSGDTFVKWSATTPSPTSETMNGLKWLMNVFGSLGKVVASFARADVVGVLQGIVGTANGFSFETGANSKGFFTAISDAVPASRTHHVQLNTKTIPQLREGCDRVQDFGFTIPV
ncbi:uncharacterized protein BJX67DRAFT_354950 [Aspergillus lucknowensis]|uniref:Uncharacterized protein n=1 Tax=Aspergillus lucknowensis TaxID=176173 RepID=A0ABR4LPM6_9EURO